MSKFPFYWEVARDGYTGPSCGPANDLTKQILEIVHECKAKQSFPAPLLVHGQNTYAMVDRDICINRDAFSACVAPAVLERLVSRMHHLETEMRALMVLAEVATSNRHSGLHA